MVAELMNSERESCVVRQAAQQIGISNDNLLKVILASSAYDKSAPSLT
jgi:hypothetical protein